MQKNQEPSSYRDWSGLALAVTMLWAGVVIVYVVTHLEKIWTMEPNAVGDFFAGAFGPIALMWLVYGYQQQGEDLRLNTEALHLQHNELVNSVNEQRKLVAEQEKQTQIARSQLIEERDRASLAEYARDMAAQPFLVFEADQKMMSFDDAPYWAVKVRCHIQPCADLWIRFTSIGAMRRIESIGVGAEETVRMPNLSEIDGQELVVDYRDITGKNKTLVFIAKMASERQAVFIEQDEPGSAVD